MCPLQEDIVKNVKVFNYVFESLQSSKIKEKSLLRLFKSVFLPVFEEFFNTDFWILVCLSNLQIQMAVYSEMKAQWQKVHCHCPEPTLTTWLQLLWCNLRRRVYIPNEGRLVRGLQNGDLMAIRAGISNMTFLLSLRNMDSDLPNSRTRMGSISKWNNVHPFYILVYFHS